MMNFEELATAPNRALEALIRSASAPAPETLIGYEWRGFNTAPQTRLMGIQKFIKGFYSAGGQVEGYNIQVAQNGLVEPWLPAPDADQPRRYGYYVVTRVDMASRDRLYPDALLINYGASPRNPRLGIERLLRDYLAQPDPANPDLMLGKAYMAIGPLRPFASFFVIERLRATDWVP